MSKKAEVAEVAEKVDVIQQELVKHNITEAALLEMEEQYMKLTINGVDDKEGLKLVYEARIRCKNTRVLTSKLCKDLREDAVRIQKEIIGKERDVVSRISTVENYLKEQEDTIEQIKAEAKAKKDREEQERIQYRTMMLFQHGVAFNGEVYSIGEIRITALQVKLLDDFTFEGLFAQVAAEFQIEQTKKVEEERIRLEEEERIKKVAEEQRLQAEELQKREAALVAKELEMKAKAEAEALAVETVRKNIAEEKAQADNARIKVRAAQLFTLGLGFNGDAYKFGKDAYAITVPQINLLSLNQEDWDKLLAATSDIVAKEKERVAQEVAVKQAEDRIAAENKARGEMEIRIKAEETAKLKALEEEELRIQREEMLKPDKAKLEKLAAEITNYILPELSTVGGKDMIPEIKVQFEKFGAWLQSKANTINLK